MPPAAQPGDARAITYLAIADAQGGDLDAALARLRALLADAPADAPWRPGVEALVSRMEAETGQADMIEGMVTGLAERLEAEPDDAEGWRRLARSYEVLGRPGDARAAWEQVRRLLPGDAEAAAALAESDPDAEPDAEPNVRPLAEAPAVPRSTPAPR